VNLYREDRNLRFVLERALPPAQLTLAEPVLDELGRAAGDELDPLAAAADRGPPVLRSFDGRGRGAAQRMSARGTADRPRERASSAGWCSSRTASSTAGTSTGRSTTR
jgi:hypothetical protein